METNSPGIIAVLPDVIKMCCLWLVICCDCLAVCWHSEHSRDIDVVDWSRSWTSVSQCCIVTSQPYCCGQQFCR